MRGGNLRRHLARRFVAGCLRSAPPRAPSPLIGATWSTTSHAAAPLITIEAKTVRAGGPPPRKTRRIEVSAFSSGSEKACSRGGRRERQDDARPPPADAAPRPRLFARHRRPVSRAGSAPLQAGGPSAAAARHGGARPCVWTRSGGVSDRARASPVLELARADVARGGAQVPPVVGVGERSAALQGNGARIQMLPTRRTSKATAACERRLVR